MEQGRFGAVRHLPARFTAQQGGDAVIHQGVVGPFPADARMAAEQAADAGIGGQGSAQFSAQQGDQQQLGLGHQGLEGCPGLRAQPFIPIQHQHPVALYKLQGLVAGGGKVAGPGTLVHRRPLGPGDGDGVVLRSGIHHDDLVDEADDRGQAAFQSLGLVPHDHRETEHQSVNPVWATVSPRPKLVSNRVWAPGIWPGLQAAGRSAGIRPRRLCQR